MSIDVEEEDKPKKTLRHYAVMVKRALENDKNTNEEDSEATKDNDGDIKVNMSRFKKSQAELVHAASSVSLSKSMAGSRSESWGRSLSHEPQSNQSQKTIPAMFVRKNSLKRMVTSMKRELDKRHEYIFGILSRAFGITYSNAEMLCIKTGNLQMMGQFFSREGSVDTLMFFYQSIDELRKGLPQILITTGNKHGLEGKGISFLKRKGTDITSKNIHSSLIFHSLQGKYPVLESLSISIKSIFLKRLEVMSKWGKLSRDDALDRDKMQAFDMSVMQLATGVDLSIDAVSDALHLEDAAFEIPIDPKDNEEFINFTADSDDHIEMCRDVLTIWMKQIGVVLSETYQLRKESDDAGPEAELHYWKQLETKFDIIQREIEHNKCVVVVQTLRLVGSSMVTQWENMLAHLQELDSEARDNVKYLCSLEKYLEPLYKQDPLEVLESVPPLLNAIHMVFTVSRYYNTPQALGSLFAKISNQMITGCKQYLTHNDNGGPVEDWFTPQQLQKLRNCLRLFTGYQEVFYRCKERLEANNQSGKKLNFSQASVFGKSHLFCQRLEELIFMFVKHKQFQKLVDINNIIENIAHFYDRFQRSMAPVLAQQKTFVNYKVRAFERNFYVFKQQSETLESDIEVFIDSAIHKVSDIKQSISMLDSLSRIEFLEPNLEDRASIVWLKFGQEIESVRLYYEAYKNNIPLGRNFPLVAGKITWGRQLAMKIDEPVAQLTKYQKAANSPDGKRIIRAYNKLSATFVEFEMLWHAEWCKTVTPILSATQSTIFSGDLSQDKIYVNFDPKVSELIREIQCMSRLGLKVPEECAIFAKRSKALRVTVEKLHFLLRSYRELRTKVPEHLLPLFQPQLRHLQESFAPGFYEISWRSMTLEDFIQKIEDKIKRIEDVIEKVIDLERYRIDSSIVELEHSSTKVPFLPKKPLEIDGLVMAAEKSCKFIEKNIEILTGKIELALKNLIGIVTATYDEKDMAFVKRYGESAIMYYGDRIYFAVLKAMRILVESVKIRMALNFLSAGDIQDGSLPVCYSELELEPNRCINPSGEEIQESISKIALRIKSLPENLVPEISDEEIVSLFPASEDDSLNLRRAFKDISKDKEITRRIMMMTSAVKHIRNDIQNFVESFDQYDFLIGNVDIEEIFRPFFASNPYISDYQAEIRNYEYLEKEIIELPDEVIIGPILINCEKVKGDFLQKTRERKETLGGKINLIAKESMDQLTSFIDTTTKDLGHPLETLEQVKEALNILEEIRIKEMDIELDIQPIEEIYDILVKHRVPIPNIELEKVADLRHSWRKLQGKAFQAQVEISKLEEGMKGDVLSAAANLKTEMAEFVQSYETKGPTVPNIDVDTMGIRYRHFIRQCDLLEQKASFIKEGEELFGLPVEDFSSIPVYRKQLKLVANLHSLNEEIVESVSQFRGTPWVEVQVADINNQLSEYQMRIRKFPKVAKSWNAFTQVNSLLSKWINSIPLLENLRHPAIQLRHWNEIFKVIGKNMNSDISSCKLQELVDLDIGAHADAILLLCHSAVKETEVETKLATVETTWVEEEFTIVNYKSRGKIMHDNKVIQEILTSLDDSLLLLASLMNSRFNGPFKESIGEWVRKLSVVSERVEQWIGVQNTWVYLEAVFDGGDIAKEMPLEAKRFANVDKQWCKLMKRANENPNVVIFTNSDEGLVSMLPFMAEQLELCQNSLSGYLEVKRSAFPRFYFISDPPLLEILGQASKAENIQYHLKSIFDSINEVSFSNDSSSITGIKSKEGECITLSSSVSVLGNVESWLDNLRIEMQKTMNVIIKEASEGIFKENLDKFLKGNSAQACLVALQVLWTFTCEDALSQIKKNKKNMLSNLKMMSNLLSSLVGLTASDSDKMERIKLETLVTIQIHQRDAFDALAHSNIKSVVDFEWLKQLRLYWNRDKHCCVVSITDVDFTYQNEYLGCTPRLVVTPLTDRCYITLAQAIGMCLGGSPTGPAGTGKTETVKDMGKCLGKFVLVFNCSDQMDYRALGRIYKGLSQSGCWGCFDEFNRIELPVLSVAAQQIGSLLNARKERSPEFVFTDGSKIPLNTEFGIFVTMNPGYAGRQELPENLKVLMRSVSMMVPDRQIIIRVLLASSGFQKNAVLAKKFYILYNLCEEQLSKQHHYDFGLRNILSVLKASGKAKRENPHLSEASILIRILRDTNLSKLVDHDEPLFLSFINDLFPGVYVESEKHVELGKTIAQSAEKMGFILHSDWLQKILQLYETTKVRHGIMILGPSGSGKSSVIKVLMNALTDIGEPHKETRMNPKSFTADQMFGHLDVATNGWTDGIFSVIWRRTMAKQNEEVWLTLDGPVDTNWIESLNSVLDDNKILTLANGDRVPMLSHVRLIFEVANLNNASPATVSRAGMIYMKSSSLGWLPVVEAWLATVKKAKMPEYILKLFEAHCEKLGQFVKQNCETKMDMAFINSIASTIRIIKGMTEKLEEVLSSLAETHRRSLLDKIFAFACIWSIGGQLELNDRVKVHEYLVAKGFQLPECKENESVYDYSIGDDGKWKHWSTLVPAWEYPKSGSANFSSIMVPTLDNVRISFLIGLIRDQKHSVLLIGDSGTAKTVNTVSYLKSVESEHSSNKVVNLSSATTPNILQKIIEGVVDKRIGNSYGPPAGKKMILFVDNINMPEITEWGDQPTNELFRQLVEQAGFYSLEKPGEWKHIVDVEYLGAMIHPGGGRNDIPARMKRHFTIFNCATPSEVSIDTIYHQIISGHYSVNFGFSAQVASLSQSLASMTRKIWQATKSILLPTPSKSHYVFNLRDLSRIAEGLVRGSVGTIKNGETLLQLWVHETSRVIKDRLINKQDRDWFNTAMLKLLRENEEHLKVSVSKLQKKYFIHFLTDEYEEKEAGENGEVLHFEQYEALPNMTALRERLEYFIDQYNETVRGSHMDLVLFHDAMKHLMRLARILSTKGGHGLLVGVGGSGKKSLTKLASFICGYKLIELQVSNAYDVNNLKEDIKVLYNIAGFEGNPVTFIFCDSNIKEDLFMEYINHILTATEISGLFSPEELDSLLGDLVLKMKIEHPGLPDTSENLYNFFMNRVKDNLHVILCFSPSTDKFRTWTRKFPGLISGTTIDWYNKWPEEALKAVATKKCHDFDLNCSAEIKNQVINHMSYVHAVVADASVEYAEQFRRQTHVTPMSFLGFLAGYMNLYADKKKDMGDMADRMKNGLGKVIEAREEVSHLQTQLAEKEIELAAATIIAQNTLAEISISKAAAEETRNEVLVVKEKMAGIASSMDADKMRAEEQLEIAKPALQEAVNALNQIRPSDIASVRKLRKPPNLIQRIMDCVLLLRKGRLDSVRWTPDLKTGIHPSWGEALRMLSQPDFLGSLLGFDKDGMNEETVEFLEPYLEGEDFNFETAKKVCGDVAGLCAWVRAMITYYGVNKTVIPLKDEVRVAEVKLQAALDDLSVVEAQLADKQAVLDEMMRNYEGALAEKENLQTEAQNCRTKISIAEQLISGFAGERMRWTTQCEQFDKNLAQLVGDVALASAFLSYCGPFNQYLRDKLLQNWIDDIDSKQIPHTEGMNVMTLLVDMHTLSLWQIQGLPTDELSSQNGIIVTKSISCPLLIDPQGQGREWIYNRERANGLHVTQFKSKNFRSILEECVSNGYPILIQDIEETIDLSIENILLKNYIKTPKGLKVKIIDKEVDFSPQFKIFLTTKMSNPTYSPETYARTSIVDFTVTLSGLEEQLLGRVILKEHAELERERFLLLETVSSHKKHIKDLEDNLLIRLSNTEGNLVDDDMLVEVLSETRKMAKEIGEKLTIANETKSRINSKREEYRAVATRGSVMYFLITEMGMINIMYQTSLSQFLTVFNNALDEAPHAQLISTRVENLIDSVTWCIYQYSARSLFEQHKFLFLMQLSIKIDKHSNKISEDEYQFFLKAGSLIGVSTHLPKKHSLSWVPDDIFQNLVALSKLTAFKGLMEQMKSNDKGWKRWFSQDAPESSKLPDAALEGKITQFERLLVVRAWCQDRTIFASQQYILDSLGEKFLEVNVLDIKAIFEESSTSTPLIALLTQGSDPSSMIEALARKMKVPIISLSMGQGQEVHAKKILSKAMRAGGWVLLQNCHLCLNFVKDTIDILKEHEDIERSFRLWMTTEPHINFPISLLHCSIKFTNETPQGVKAGLRRTFSSITPDMLNIVDSKYWRPCLYALAFLHTTVQERRKYGPLGWNIPYEFNQTDLAASIQFVQNYLYDCSPRKSISWNTIRYMTGEIHYGGRVTDDFDRRLLKTYCRSWFGEQMLNSNFKFYKNYPMPTCKTVDEFNNFIESMPISDTPEIFGLHSNADIAFRTKQATDIFNAIIDIQPKEMTMSGNETMESQIDKLAKQLLERLPEEFPKEDVQNRTREIGSSSPLIVFLSQEIDLVQKVLVKVKTTLSDLIKALSGTIVMNEHSVEALHALRTSRVPKQWTKITWESPSLSAWYADLEKKCTQYRQWLRNGKLNSYWLAGFFNAQGFLTSVTQEVTRNHSGWSLDYVRLHTEVVSKYLADVVFPPNEGVYIHGLFLEGAGWDKRERTLIEPTPKLIYTPMPCIHISAVQVSTPREKDLYVCPVYRRSERTDLNYIFDCYVKPCIASNPKTTEHWILRGVAMLCSYQ
eukprot:Nk52_evm3s2496 gene=Nk52_evmTU3s2496